MGFNNRKARCPKYRFMYQNYIILRPAWGQHAKIDINSQQDIENF